MLGQLYAFESILKMFAIFSSLELRGSSTDMFCIDVMNLMCRCISIRLQRLCTELYACREGTGVNILNH